ncbi:unnamed protein product [Calypogeia fissa]
MCIPLNALVGGAWWPQEAPPTRAHNHHHELHNHSKEDDCIADCICCPCNILCYILLAIEEYLCCCQWFGIFGSGDNNLKTRRSSFDPQIGHGYGRFDYENSLRRNNGSSRPRLQASLSSPSQFGRLTPRPSPAQLSTSASLRPGLCHGHEICEIEQHCWECERRRRLL